MINQQASVKNVEILQNTINSLNQNEDSLFQRIQEDLASKKNLVEETRREESTSNNLLSVAKAIEAEKLAELIEAESEMASAVASENPVAIAAAASQLASAQQEYSEAKEHRERLEHRYELAQQCVSISELMYSEVERSYAFSKQSVETTTTAGVSRLFNAKNDLENYLRKTSNSINYSNESQIKKNSSIDGNESLVQSETKSEPVLTSSQKQLIKNETGWDDEIIDHIKTMDQYEIYKKAGLTQKIVNGRKCLVKEINLDYEDPKSGMTNRELMAMGRAPYDDKTGERIELHHMNQEFDGPFAELRENTEHGDGNQTILHLNGSDSWRNDIKKKNQYKNHDRPEHWQSRLEDLNKNGQAE